MGDLRIGWVRHETSTVVGMNVGIEQIMRGSVMTGTPHQTKGHVRQIMAEHRISAFPIVDPEDVPVGMVTAADLLLDHPDGAPVSGFMSSPVLTVPRYEKPHIAARIMRNHRIHHLVVTEDHKAVGIVSAFDLLHLIEDHRFVAKSGPTPRAKDNKRR